MTSEDTLKLLPCPFCGGKGVLAKTSCSYQDVFSVNCCFVYGRCRASIGNYETEDEAIKAWNTRRSRNDNTP